MDPEPAEEKLTDITGYVQDGHMANPDGSETRKLPHGVSLRRATPHFDERGMVCEMYDPRWGWHPDPLVFAYVFTVRPGKVKGWGMHKLHEDRYFLLSGDMKLVLYDDRPNRRRAVWCASLCSPRRIGTW